MPTLRFFVMLEEWRKQRRHRDMFSYMLMQATRNRRFKEDFYGRLMKFLATGEAPEVREPADPVAFATALKRGMETLKRREGYAKRFFGKN